MYFIFGGVMGDQLYLERFVWFDHEARKERYPNASKLVEKFELSVKSAQRTIDYFCDRLRAPLEYESSHKGYYYIAPTFQLPVIRRKTEVTYFRHHFFSLHTSLFKLFCMCGGFALGMERAAVMNCEY
jgi:hypothetical protein